MNEQETIIYHLTQFKEVLLEHYPHSWSIVSTIEKEFEKYIKGLQNEDRN